MDKVSKRLSRRFLKPWKVYIELNPSMKSLIYRVSVHEDGTLSWRVAAKLIWSPGLRQWYVRVFTGSGVEFITDEGTFRKPPKELVEVLVAAGR